MTARRHRPTMDPMANRTRWTVAAVAATLLACVLAWLVAGPDEDEATVVADPSPPPVTKVAAPVVAPEPRGCAARPERPFTPESVSMEGIVDRAAVIGVPRDGRGVTGVLPISNKVDFAWDLGGVRPGERRGNVLLNTHTWEDGTALGNALLDHLDLGDRIVLRGGGSSACYEVDLRIEVPVEEGYAPYYEDDGPHRVAIVVCSGDRSPTGEWSHRTIWFARAVR